MKKNGWHKLSHQKPPHVIFYPHHLYTLVSLAPGPRPNGKTGWRPSNFFQVSVGVCDNALKLEL